MGRCVRAGRGKPDIDVVVQLEWMNPKTTKQHLILQNSGVVSKKKNQKMLRMLTQPRDRGVEWSLTVQPLRNRATVEWLSKKTVKETRNTTLNLEKNRVVEKSEMSKKTLKKLLSMTLPLLLYYLYFCSAVFVQAGKLISV